VLALGIAPALAQSVSVGEQNLQIHGFATQGFLVSSENNYLGINTGSGSTAWTEAAINVNDEVTNRLRVGVQFHYTRLGAFGGDDPTVDWALGDFTINRWAGIRAGKVKMRWGLYNDTQDYDPGYMWSLLPEGIYGIDIRATDLSQNGVELYGVVPLMRNLGKMEYSAYYGDYTVASNDGIMESFKESGLAFTSPPGGKTPGFDLRWKTPLSGLKIGGSLMMYDAKGNLTNGTYVQPLAFCLGGHSDSGRKDHAAPRFSDAGGGCASTHASRPGTPLCSCRTLLRSRSVSAPASTRKTAAICGPSIKPPRGTP